MSTSSNKNIDQAQQEALATLGIYALEQKDLETIMQRAIDLSCIILDLDCAVIFAINKERGTLEIGAQAGCAAEMDPIDISQEWDIGYAFQNEDPTVVTNYTEEERFAISPFLKDEGVVSSLNVTVRGNDDSYGLLGFYAREQRKFTKDEVHFVQVIANIVGMAIQNKYAREDLEKEVQRSEKYQREILNNSLAERWELGGFLHDKLGQVLVSIKINIGEIQRKLIKSDVNAAKELEKISALVDESISGIRDLTHDIIPVDIEDEGVEHAIRFLMRHTQKMHGIKCELKSNAVLSDMKNRKAATNLYHIIQEAIRNAAIHGEAKKVTVQIAKSNGNLILSIEDDGSGFSDSENDNNGKGIRIMRHRVELMEGTFEMVNKSDSEDSTGTVVKCKIPMDLLIKKADRQS